MRELSFGWLVLSPLYVARGSARDGRAEDDGKYFLLRFLPTHLTVCSLSRYPSLPALYLLYEDDWGRVRSLGILKPLQITTYIIFLSLTITLLHVSGNFYSSNRLFQDAESKKMQDVVRLKLPACCMLHVTDVCLPRCVLTESSRKFIVSCNKKGKT